MHPFGTDRNLSHMSNWFTNRGQMVQVGCALITAVVSLMVWFAVPPQNLLYIAPIIFVACLLWGVWKIAVWYTLSHLPSPSPTAPPTLPISVETKKDGGPIPVTANFYKFVCPLGDHCKIGSDLSEITITVRELRKFEEKNAPVPVVPPIPDYEAELDIQHHGILYCGSQVKREAGTKRFSVPANSEDLHPEPYSLFKFNFTEKYFSSYIIRLYHINMVAKTATIHVCEARGLKA
jgi:hypothetical protein